MPSTPPPTSLRPHTPPTPFHGPQYDTYEPYSPRRSKRATAQSNPYSSFHGQRSPKGPPHVGPGAHTPPTTIKKARFAAPPQLSSPPSSPTSPARQRSPTQLHKTPRKNSGKLKGAASVTANGAHSDSDGPLRAPPSIDPAAMFPTPLKTPRKRQAAVTSTARILSFQPSDPNDVMPAARKITKNRSGHRRSGFELYDEEAEPSAHRNGSIEIFTDPNARVPVMDESEDNPFLGRKKPARPQRRATKMSPTRAESDRRINEAVRNDEGMTYVFRGKKIFRRFEDPTDAGAAADDGGEAESTLGVKISGSPQQRMLRNKAGAAAQRPLTRSAIKPRLLFPSAEQRLERNHTVEEDDEEAATDIDMPTVENNVTSIESHSASFPSTSQRATRSTGKHGAVLQQPVLTYDPIGADQALQDPVTQMDIFPISSAITTSARDSPFDSWQRTKGGRKRPGDVLVGDAVAGASSGKRARSVALESPA